MGKSNDFIGAFRHRLKAIFTHGAKGLRGIYESGIFHRIWIYWSWLRPSTFERARSKKLCKNRRFLIAIADFLPLFMVFCFWFIFEWMVANKLIIFQFYEKFLKFRCPWWPWGRLHSILKGNWLISSSVLWRLKRGYFLNDIIDSRSVCKRKLVLASI